MTQSKERISHPVNVSNNITARHKKKRMIMVYSAAVVAFMLTALAHAGGISFDAGLTPAEDRWILRTQVRSMSRSNDPSPMNREMRTVIFPVVLAYGLRPDLTIMVRQAGLSKEMSMAGNTDKSSGTGDFFVLAKYRAYRINTPDYTLGIAPTLGIELPTGKTALSSDTYDVNTGLFVSLRRGLSAVDANFAYMWNGFAGGKKNGFNPGDELSFNVAFAHQIVIGKKARSSLAPVFEMNYRHIRADRIGGNDAANSGESAVYLSPGVKFTMSTLILEALVQIPAWQDQKGAQTERDVGIISGIRYLF